MGTYRTFQPTLRHPRAKHRKQSATKPEGSLVQEAVLGFWPVQKVPLLMADTLFLRQHRGVPPAPTRSMVSQSLLPKLLDPPTRKKKKNPADFYVTTHVSLFGSLNNTKL